MDFIIGTILAVVICPLSVTEGWALEMARFAPKLRVLRYVGNKGEREELRRSISEHVNKQAPSARVGFNTVLIYIIFHEELFTESM